MPTITITPFGRSVTAARGESLRDVLQKADILLDYPCGGKGTCRKCRVTIDPPPTSGRGKLSERGERGRGPPGMPDPGGGRLHGRHPRGTALEEDLVAGRPQRGHHDGGRQRVIPQDRDRPPRPVTRGPALGLGQAPRRARRPGHPGSDARATGAREAVGPPAGECLDSGGAVRGKLVPVAGRPPGGARTRVRRRPRHDDRRYRPARSRDRRAARAARLPQPAGVLRRRRHVPRPGVPRREGSCPRTPRFPPSTRGPAALLADAGVRPSQVLKTVMVGNPIMIHILNGIDPWQLTLCPTSPSPRSSLRGEPRTSAGRSRSMATWRPFPLISAYVGADTIGMIVALDLEEDATTSLSIDIGTNGEMVLSRRGELLTTSTAAGPAFEGAQISCGMRALEGAIVGVVIDPAGEVTRAPWWAAARPRGICGTGLISAVAALLDRGVIDETGRLVEPGEIAAPGLAARVFSVRIRAAVRPVGRPAGLRLAGRHAQAAARQGRRAHRHRDAAGSHGRAEGRAGRRAAGRELRGRPRRGRSHAHRPHPSHGPRARSTWSETPRCAGRSSCCCRASTARSPRARRAAPGSSSWEESPSSRRGSSRR